MKITDYVVTPEGEEFRDQIAEKLMQEDPAGKRRRGPLWDQLMTLHAIGGHFYRKEYSTYLRELPALEQRGFIARVEGTSVTKILESIESSEVKRDLDIYYRIAKDERVPDEEVNYLFNKSWDAIESSARNRTYGGAAGDVKSTLKLLKKARTRSDKIIAIDATFSLMHDLGGVATFGFWDIDSEESPDTETSNRFLTRLFEE